MGPWPTPSLCPCLDSGIQGLAPASESKGAEGHGVGTRLEVRKLVQRARDRVITLHKLPAAWEDAAPFHCDTCRLFRTKGHTWDWRARLKSTRVSLDWEEAGKWKPQGIHRGFGAQHEFRTEAGRSGKVCKNARAAGEGPRLPNLDTHSGGWANWHPRVWFSAGVAAVYSGTRTHSPGGGVGGRSVGQGNPSLQPAIATSSPARLTLQSRTRIQLVWAQGRCS